MFSHVPKSTSSRFHTLKFEAVIGVIILEYFKVDAENL